MEKKAPYFLPMKLDIYSCDRCPKGFAVEGGAIPVVCPHCGSHLWEFSHSGELVQLEDEVNQSGREPTRI